MPVGSGIGVSSRPAFFIHGAGAMIETLNDLENLYEMHKQRVLKAQSDLTERGKQLHDERIQSLDERIKSLQSVRERVSYTFDNADTILSESRIEMRRIRERISRINLDKKIQRIAEIENELNVLKKEIADYV